MTTGARRGSRQPHPVHAFAPEMTATARRTRLHPPRAALPVASFASDSKKAPGHRSPDAFHRSSAQPAVADRPYPSTQQRLRRAIVPGFTNRLCTRRDVT